MAKIEFPLKEHQSGRSVANLQDALKRLLEGGEIKVKKAVKRIELTVGLAAEQLVSLYGPATEALVELWQEQHDLKSSGDVDEATAASLNKAMELWDQTHPVPTPPPPPVPTPPPPTPTPPPVPTPPPPSPDEPRYVVEGRVASRTRPAAAGLRVKIVDKGVGGDAPLAEGTTDASGRFQVSFLQSSVAKRGKDRPDLQARVFSGAASVGASAIRYNAAQHETLDILLDDKASGALPSEYEALISSLSRHHRGPLAELQESADRQDITYLSHKSGWDARSVALAALADQFSARTKSPVTAARIEPPLFYALFRAGLAADETSIYRLAPAAVENVWKQAIVQGVMPAAFEAGLPSALAYFQEVAAQRLLQGPAVIGASSFKDLVAGTLKEGFQQRQFAELYSKFGNDSEALWRNVGEKFGEAVTHRLRLDGQLAYLTLNNAPLIRRLHAEAGRSGLGEAAQLVASGFYRPDRWLGVIGDSPVPPEIPGRDLEERSGRYAELLAAQIRLSFPTAVVAEMVRSGETPVASEPLAERVHAFLAEHGGKFEIGAQPVARYAALNGLELEPEVAREVSRIQRVYQITPDDQAMNGLLREGVDSASAAMRYEPEEFIRAFAGAVGGEANARLVHAKARQVHSAVLNVAIGYLTAKAAPGIGVHSPPSIVNPVPSPLDHADDVLAYATLEGLFGEMDYCACDHCRSVLSPAAYLVDLLTFIDRPASEIPAGFLNPLTVLRARRPDIEHLPLTCENTNTPLPYIDLVNETLEHYVANGLSLALYAGHNTDGSVPAEELLASPQFVSDTAYPKLATETFPPPLPFHQPLEYLRRCFARFDAPLARVMEDLRVDDTIDRTGSAEYDWRDIRMEAIGLSRPEHRLLTERWLTGIATDVMLTVKHLYGFDPATADADVRTVLDNAKSFSRRVGISYEQLVEILKTRFVNPASALIPKLERLGVPFATLKALKNGTMTDAAFDALLAPGLDTAAYGGDIKLWVKDSGNFGEMMSLLTLTNPVDPTDICNFDAVELHYSNPDATANRLRPFEFVRLIRFIRLWRKLGWTIEQTDRAITALYPAAQAPDQPSDAVNVERLDLGFLDLLPSLAVLHEAMSALRLTPKKDLPALLACVAPIDTHGQSSLYRQMFLGASQQDPAFAEDGFGNYFPGPSKNLVDHGAALRAAFSLTSDEFDQIVAALGNAAATPLGLDFDNISAVFRRAWLARKLRLSVREFLLLAALTGYDPFEKPDPAQPALLSLIRFVERLRALDIKSVQALYLVWNQDLSGKSAPTEAGVRGFARSLRGSLSAIEQEFVVVDDPDGSITRSRMALAFGSEAADLFFALLENSSLTSIPYSHHQAVLDGSILSIASNRIGYDDFAKRLSFTGVLDPLMQSALKSPAAATPAFQAAVDDLFDENQKIVGPLFARYPGLLPLHDAYRASTDPQDIKRTALLAAMLPELRSRRKRQQALQLAATLAEADPRLVGALLEDAAVLHSVGSLSDPALDDLVALERPGLAVDFFFGATATGTPSLSLGEGAGLDYSQAGPAALPANPTAGAPVSGIWTGFLEAGETGLHKLELISEPGAIAALTLDGTFVALTKTGGTWTNAGPIELRAGTLHAFSLTVESVKDDLSLRWQTQARGWETVPLASLYSASLVDHLRATYTRLLKVDGLASALRLTAAEMAHLAADPDYQSGGEGWLNRLTTTGDPDAATASALFKAFSALLDFARLKRGLSTGDERLLEVLRDPAGASAGPQDLFFQLTRWEKPSVDALRARFNLTAPAALAHVAALSQLYDAFEWISRLGVSAPVLIAAATNEPTAPIVRDLQSALRARYDERGWLDVLKPINDAMRTAQRDALVAYILHQMRSNPASAHIDTPEKLFEFFLMDVQMECCMLTSRIRHALSGVQLFIERGLMNLETKVSPASLKAKQWEWMKRYRLWEALRKIYLFPENWLEPEYRDDQSPLFKEAMSELLQGDITEERAAEALVDYLTKLEDIAKLEICGMHFIEGQPGTADDVTYVVARTAGANRKYYVRRREYGSWTAWEKIALDIEDNPVLPVLWKNRLFLFWLKLLQDTEQRPPAVPAGTRLDEVSPSAAFPSSAPTVAIKAILTWSEFVGGKWQPPRTSDPAAPLLVTEGLSLGEASVFRSGLRLSVMFWTNDALRVIVSYKGWEGSSFFLHNAFSTPERRGSKEAHFLPKRSLDTNSSPLEVTYLPSSSYTHRLLINSVPDNTVDPHHPQAGKPWDAPFFYEDSRHAFYVTTTEKLVTVPNWHDYLLNDAIQAVDPQFPSLVTAIDTGPFEVMVPSTRRPGFGTFDPSPIKHLLNNDANVSIAIGTPGTIPYGNVNIGPSGSQFSTSGGEGQ